MKKITAEEFDARFDRGEDVMEFLDMSTARRPNQELGSKQKQVCRPGTSRQAYARKSPARRYTQVN